MITQQNPHSFQNILLLVLSIVIFVAIPWIAVAMEFIGLAYFAFFAAIAGAGPANYLVSGLKILETNSNPLVSWAPFFISLFLTGLFVLFPLGWRKSLGVALTAVGLSLFLILAPCIKDLECPSDSLPLYFQLPYAASPLIIYFVRDALERRPRFLAAIVFALVPYALSLISWTIGIFVA